MFPPEVASSPAIQPIQHRQEPTTPSSSYDAGRQAAEPYRELPPYDTSLTNISNELWGVYTLIGDDNNLRGTLERAQNDPEFAAGFVEALGADRYASLVRAYDLAGMNDGPGSVSSGDASQMLSLLGKTLGAATRAPGSQVDAQFVQQVTGRDGARSSQLDPELAAILVNEGDFTPETAAELGAHVILNDDPPALEPAERYPEHRETLLQGPGENNLGAWPTALRGILKNQASSELLAIRGDNPGDATVAARLLDPNLITSSHDRSPTGGFAPRVNDIPVLVGAVLDTPRANLASNPNDQSAMAAVESLMLATDAANGRVGEWAREPLGDLYMAHAGEILNAGEGASAFPTSRDTPLGRYLADSEPLRSGSGGDLIAAALTAEGPPPYKPQHGPPGLIPPERYGSWQEAIQAATGQYRSEVNAHGAPRATDATGGDFRDLNALASEIADIDAELVQGQFGANAIRGADVDNANAAKQQAVNIISDYAGAVIGLGGAWQTVGATYYNTHVESSVLEHFWPTDNAKKVFTETVPAHERQLLAAQAVQIVDAGGRSGAIALPENLRDPATGGLRVPEPGADANRFASDLANFIAGNPAVRQAVDKARSDLEARVTAMDIGQYRGGR